MTRTKVDVVILSWNDGHLLDTAVSSALESREVDVRVFVVDNGSDPPVQLVDDDRVTVLRNEANRGVPGGRNQGFESTHAAFVCFLDSDARLHPDCLAALLSPQLADERVAVTAPVFAGQLPEASAGKAPSLWRKMARGLNLVSTYVAVRPAHQGLWDVDFAIGACQLVRRTAFEDVGGLDAGYLFGPEDVDFCLRVRQRGWCVLQVAAAVCDHPPRRAHRRIMSRRGLAHARALARHYWRHRPHLRAS